MATHAQSPQQHHGRDRTFAVLHALLQLGPGHHKFGTIAERSGLSISEAHRRLQQLIDAGLCHRPSHGNYELRSTTAGITGAPGLVFPTATPLPEVAPLLDGLHRRTQQVVLLHTYFPLSGERLCIGAAGDYDPGFRQELAHTPQAIDVLRQAPLGADAPGLTILANLTDHSVPMREDLRRIRNTQLARTRSPLPGWTLVSVPIRRLPGAPAFPGAEPRVVAAVSILTPEPSNGGHHVAYGRLLRSAVHAAMETSVAVDGQDLVAAPAA